MNSTRGVEVRDIRRLTSDVPSFAIAFIGQTAAFVLAEETVLLSVPNGERRSLKLHAGAILSVADQDECLVTGGDDGRIMALGPDGRPVCIAADQRRRWIDNVSSGSGRNVAWSAGKQAFWRSVEGEEASIEVSSSVGGLAFAPNASTLAVAHYNGVTLWGPGTSFEPRLLSWKGAHKQPLFCRDGKVLATTMRENTIHAWDVTDGTDLPTPSYPSRVHSMDWTADGRFLVTSGSDRLIALSFQHLTNPLARMPLLLAPYGRLAVAVACHPRKEFVAVGYADGLVLLVRVPEGDEIVIRAPDGHQIAALKWDRLGEQLGIASESGDCRVITMG
jgi:WD40 repeat protein